jgi:hypothetical protein
VFWPHLLTVEGIKTRVSRLGAGGGEDLDRYGRFENHHRIWRVGSKTPVIKATTGG